MPKGQPHTKQVTGNKPSVTDSPQKKRPVTGKDPERIKDFNVAMNSLVKTKRNAGRTAMLTEKDLTHVEKYKQLNPNGHLRREEIFDQFKRDNKNLAREEAAYQELEDCTFQPDTYLSKRANDDVEQRDLYEFLNDQQRFLEYRSLKSLKSKQEAIDLELKEVKPKPELDGLSVQLVNMMDDRRYQTTHDRLYAVGKEKIRSKNLQAVKEKQQQRRALSPTKALQSAGYHRGKPTRAALYDLHADILKHKDEVKKAQEYEDYLRANTRFRNKESDEHRIEGFRKEFYQNLLDIKNREQMQQGLEPDNQVEPKEHSLDFNHVAVIMHQMGFLQAKLSNEQEDQLNDLYTLFKCKKEHKILAENLQNILMIIAGQRDGQLEVANDVGNHKWSNAGVYDEESGIFYLRQGEALPIQNHFRLLRLNRLHQKKSQSAYAHKRAPEQPEYKPYISPMTKKLADERRQKLYHAPPDHKIDVVTVLLHPNNVKGDVHRMDMVRKEMQDKEDKELTLHPRTLQRRNIEIFQGERQSVTGDRNQDLYLQSKVSERKDKTSNEYWLEREAHECKFQPDTSKSAFQHDGHIPQSVFEVRDVDKALQRSLKAQKDRAFKAMMTQRSGYSPTKGQQRARDDLVDVSRMSTGSSQFRTQRETQPRKGLGGADGAQLVPRKANRSPQRPSGEKPIMNTRQQAQPSGWPQQPQRRSPAKQQHPVHLPMMDDEQGQPPLDDQPEEYDRDDPKDLVDQQLNDIGDRIDEPDPKLYVDVNVGKNKMERIVVYEGDTAESLANKFCETHKLDKNMYDKLITLLDQQIAGVLPKIMEDEDMDDSEGQA